MKIFKILFTIAFFIFATLWILFTISYFGLYTKGWEWVEKIPVINTLSEKINAFINQFQNKGTREMGLKMLLAGGAILLGYTALFYPLKMIPFIGQLVKFMTFIIPSLSSIVVIIGLVFMFADLSSIPGLHNYDAGLNYLLI